MLSKERKATWSRLLLGAMTACALVIATLCISIVLLLPAHLHRNDIVQAVTSAGGKYLSDSVTGSEMIMLPGTTDTKLQRLCQQTVVHESAFRVMSLRGSRVTDDGLLLLTRCDRLEILDVGQTAVTAKGLHNRRIKGLSILDISSTGICGNDLKLLRDGKGLTHLTIDGAQLTGPAAAGHINAIQSLIQITISNPSFSRLSVRELLPYLSDLHVQAVGLDKSLISSNDVFQLRHALPKIKIGHGGMWR